MKNQNTTTQIAYIVTADYYTNCKPCLLYTSLPRAAAGRRGGEGRGQGVR